MSVTLSSVFVLLHWSQLNGGKLDERTEIMLPLAGIGLRHEFEHEGQRWRIVAVGNARDIGFERAPSERSAFVCAPVGHRRARSR